MSNRTATTMHKLASAPPDEGFCIPWQSLLCDLLGFSRPQSLPGRPHWLRDVNAPDLGWATRKDEDAIAPSPDWSERDWRLENQGLVSGTSA